MYLISGSPFFPKRIYPLFSAALAAIMGFTIGVGLMPKAMLFPALAFVLFFIALSIAQYYTYKDIADEVRDSGDALIIRNSGKEARIPLADIIGADFRVIAGAIWFFLPPYPPIPLDDIISMDSSNQSSDFIYTNTSANYFNYCIVLTLRTPCCFGNKVEFLPTGSWFRKNALIGVLLPAQSWFGRAWLGIWIPDLAILKSLNKRIHQARRLSIYTPLASTSNNRPL